MEIITSKKNSYLKQLRKLYDSNQRQKQGKFILEGKRIIDGALKAGAVFDVIFMTPQFAENESSIQELKKKTDNVIIKVVHRQLIQKISDTINPQGIIAIANEVQYKYRDIVSNSRCILVLDRLQDPGNMGTLIRTAVAAGADGIIALKGCVDIYNLKVLRATMGAIFNIPIISRISLSEFKEIREDNMEFKLIAAAAQGDMYYYELDYNFPFMLIIGNEANGVSGELINYSDLFVKIPLIGDIESLNAAMACGIILYDYVQKKLI